MIKRLTAISSPGLTVLIAANAFVFILLVVMKATSSVGIADSLCLWPSSTMLLRHPWTLVTYAFTQANVLQLTFNMLWLFSFGRLLLMSRSDYELIIIYLVGALIGGLAFIAFSAAIGDNASGCLMGSSASVIAVAVAVAILLPDRQLNLPLLGLTKIKWVVAVVVVFFFIGLSAPNAGGNLAHIGGAAAGAACALVITHRRKTTLSSGEYERLVERIRRSGYESLTAREKRRFFELSSNSRSK